MLKKFTSFRVKHAHSHQPRRVKARFDNQSCARLAVDSEAASVERCATQYATTKI